MRFLLGVSRDRGARGRVVDLAARQPTQSDVVSTIEGAEHLLRSKEYLTGAIDTLLVVGALHRENREHWGLLIRAYLQSEELRDVLSPFAKPDVRARFCRLGKMPVSEREEWLAPLLSRLPDAGVLASVA